MEAKSAHRTGMQGEDMKWRVDPKRRQARTQEGYVITWAENTHGTYFNAWFEGHANGKRSHLEAGYNKDKCKAACEQHLARRAVPA